MSNIMPSQITNEVREVLLSASKGKGNSPCFLTAYQILDRLQDDLKDRIIRERTSAGKGAGVYYGAASVVSDAAELINADICYMDTRGLKITSAIGEILPGNEVCGLYRLCK